MAELAADLEHRYGRTRFERLEPGRAVGDTRATAARGVLRRTGERRHGIGRLADVGDRLAQPPVAREERSRLIRAGHLGRPEDVGAQDLLEPRPERHGSPRGRFLSLQCRFGRTCRALRPKSTSPTRALSCHAERFPDRILAAQVPTDERFIDHCDRCRIWIPFRADAADHERRQGRGIYVFGRLAPGATLEGAQAELTTIAHRMASAFPETHERLRPRVMPYTMQLYDDMTGIEVPLVQTLILLLLVIVCVNIAMLVCARTATSRAEIAGRGALGASPRRVMRYTCNAREIRTSAAATLGL